MNGIPFTQISSLLALLLTMFSRSKGLILIMSFLLKKQNSVSMLPFNSCSEQSSVKQVCDGEAVLCHDDTEEAGSKRRSFLSTMGLGATQLSSVSSTVVLPV